MSELVSLSRKITEFDNALNNSMVTMLEDWKPRDELNRMLLDERSELKEQNKLLTRALAQKQDNGFKKKATFVDRHVEL